MQNRVKALLGQHGYVSEQGYRICPYVGERILSAGRAEITARQRRARACGAPQFTVNALVSCRTRANDPETGATNGRGAETCSCEVHNLDDVKTMGVWPLSGVLDTLAIAAEGEAVSVEVLIEPSGAARFQRWSWHPARSPYRPPVACPVFPSTSIRYRGLDHDRL